MNNDFKNCLPSILKENNFDFVYFDGNHKNFDKQIRSGVAKVLVDEIVYGDELSDEIKNGAIINFPSWFKDGLIS